MFSIATRKSAFAIGLLIVGAAFVASPARAQDRYVGGGMFERQGTDHRDVGGGMYERAGTGGGNRYVGGGMYERAGTGDGNRYVGGGMYERAGTGTTPAEPERCIGGCFSGPGSYERDLAPRGKPGDRAVGGGMFERAGTGTVPAIRNDRPVGGGMYERGGTATHTMIGRPLPAAPTTIVRTTVGPVRITSLPPVRVATPTVRLPTVMIRK